MSPPVDLEAASPLSFSSTSARVHNSLTSCVASCLIVIRVKHATFLTIIGALFLGLYIFDQLPLSSTVTLFPFSASQDDHSNTVLETTDLIPPKSCHVSPTPFYYPINSSNYYLAFPPSDAIPYTAVKRIVAQEAVSDECLEQWLETGTWAGACSGLRLTEPRTDFVWTWVNGSDPLHRAAREVYAPAKISERQYRQHDELRYSLRSVQSATRGWKDTRFHLVANSYAMPPFPDDEKDGEEEQEKKELRLGQVPQWFDLMKASEESPKVMVHYDVDIFRLLPLSPNGVVSDSQYAAWREASLPTFNSMAIESQLGNLPSSELADNTVFLMDDTYILRPLSTSSFHSPIHGPVFHLQPDLPVKPTGPNLPSGSSEWRGLQTAASHLSKRFGSRGRPYLVHNARSIPLPLLHEASLTFPSALASTATSRFRGQDDKNPETHALWLATQFIVERHREALLWSWVVGKWGGRKGIITPEEKAKMWTELGGEKGKEKTVVRWPKRESRLHVKEQLQSAGLPDPGPTNYAFVSSDGYPYTYLPLSRYYPQPPNENGWANLAESPTTDPAPVACTISRTECFNNITESELAVEMFKRVMLDKPTCGDCFISALVGSSGSTGFSAFLPARGESPSSSHPNAPIPPIEHLPLALPSIISFPYPSDPYHFSLRLIHRYSYVLGGTPSVFFGATGGASAKTHLTEVDRKNDTVLLCINDDLVSIEPKEVKFLDDVLKTWMDGRWPERMGIERVGEANQGRHQRAEVCV